MTNSTMKNTQKYLKNVSPLSLLGQIFSIWKINVALKIFMVTLNCVEWAARVQTQTPQRYQDTSLYTSAAGHCWGQLVLQGKCGWLAENRDCEEDRVSHFAEINRGLTPAHATRVHLIIQYKKKTLFNRVELNWSQEAMTPMQREGCETYKNSMYHQNNEEENPNQDSEEGVWFDTRVLTSENVLLKGQRENTKWHILQTDDSPLTTSL